MERQYPQSAGRHAQQLRPAQRAAAPRARTAPAPGDERADDSRRAFARTARQHGARVCRQGRSGRAVQIAERLIAQLAALLSHRRRGVRGFVGDAAGDRATRVAATG